MTVFVIDTIEAANAQPFPVVFDTGVQGGFKAVVDITARDAIPAQRRKHGMRVFVQSTEQLFQLGSGLGNGDWSEVVAGAPTAGIRDLYVDLAGDDSADGSVGSPLATLFEASVRTRERADMWRVFLNDGDHPLRDVRTDFGADTPVRNRFGAYHPIQISSLNQATVQAITILSYGTGATANVATVSETLTPGALKNAHVSHLLFGSFPWRSLILDNTASTITFASNISEWGGFFNSYPAVGAHTVTTDAGRIVQATTNPSSYENLFHGSGFLILTELTIVHGTPAFDRPAITLGYGGSGGNKGHAAGCHAHMTNVTLLGPNKGMHIHGATANLRNVHIIGDNDVAGAGVGIQGEKSGSLTTLDCSIQDLDTAYLCGEDFHMEVGGATGIYTPGCSDAFKCRDSNIDITMGFNYTGGALGRFADLQGNLAQIFFETGALVGFRQQGSGAYSTIFFGDVGRKFGLYSLEAGSASAAPLGSPNYVDLDGSVFTLAAWNALGKNIETLNGCRVTEDGFTDTVFLGGTREFSNALNTAQAELTNPHPSNANSEAFGAGTVITATGATAFGQGASVTNVDGIAIGRGSSVAHDNAIALGAGVSSSAANRMSLGIELDMGTNDLVGIGQLVVGLQSTARTFDVVVAGARRVGGDVYGGSFIQFTSPVELHTHSDFVVYQGVTTTIELFRAGSSGIGFFGTAFSAQQTITGSRAGNAALASLLTALANHGLIIDSSTA